MESVAGVDLQLCDGDSQCYSNSQWPSLQTTDTRTHVQKPRQRPHTCVVEDRDGYVEVLGAWEREMRQIDTHRSRYKLHI